MAKAHKAQKADKLAKAAKRALPPAPGAAPTAPAPAARPRPAAKPRPLPAPARLAVVVLAMHRSGSSAITRVLNLLGCDTAKTLMGPNEHNESGYWESDVLRVFNDRLLASGGSDWRDWQAFNPGWYQTPRLAEHLERGQELLKAEFGASRFFVFKDPRITRIVPFWRQLLAQAGAEPRVILTLRHPAEVAASLAKRDGMTGAEAALIWLRNMLEAEHGSRGLARAVVGYDRLLAAPSATMAALQQPLGLIWPRLSDKVAGEIDAFMSPDLRHHKADAAGFAADQPFRGWLSQTHTILHRWSETGEDRADWPALDALRAALDSLASPLREVVGVLTRQATDLATQDKEVRYLRGEAGKRGDAVAALTAEKKAQSEAHSAEKASMTEAHSAEKARMTEAFAAEKAAMAEAARTAAQTIASLTADREARTLAHEADRDEAASLRAAAEAARDQALADLDRLRAGQEALDKEMRYLRGEAGKRGDAVTALTAEKAAMAKAHAAELAQLAGALNAAQAAHQADTRRLAEEMAELIGQNMAQVAREQAHQAQIAALQGDLDLRETALAEARAAVQSLTDSLSETQSALRQRQLEAEETATALTATRQELAGLTAAQAADREAARTALDTARRTAATDAAARFDEIAALTQTLIARDTAIAAQAARIHAVNASYADLNSLADRLKQQASQAAASVTRLTRDLQARDGAVAGLMAEIDQRGAAIGHLMHLADEGKSLSVRIGQAIDAVLLQAERPWLRGKRQLARKAALLTASGLFDAEWYGAAHPDVGNSGQDPAVHFILFGRAEGRHPLPDLARFLAGLPASPAPDLPAAGSVPPDAAPDAIRDAIPSAAPGTPAPDA